jgi:hypothetical protein
MGRGISSANGDESADAKKDVLKGEEEADDRTPEEGKPLQGALWRGLRCRRAKGDMQLVVGVAAESQREETEDAGEEAGDQAAVSTSQSPLSSTRAEDGGAAKDRRALTLEYRDSNGFEGRVTALRPRNRAK